MSTATCWITGLHPHSGLLSAAVVALPPLSLRLQHLALGLALSLEAAPLSNPTALVFSTTRTADPPPPRTNPRSPLPSFISLLAWHPALLSYELLRQQHLDDDLPPLSRRTFLRSTTLSSFGTALLPSYILPHCRPNGLVDGVMRIRTAEDGQRALRWRGGVFGSYLPCFVCGEFFTRRCLPHAWERAGAFDESGAVDRAVLELVFRLVEAERKKRASKAGTLHALDLLLGNQRGDLAEIGYVTLRRWEEKMRALMV